MSLLAVHAHPDDETLSTGALLATWAAAGRPVTVVTCTRGERGEVIGRRLAHLAADPAAFGAHRLGELAAALAALGVEDHVLLDEVAGDERFVDSGMVWLGAGKAGPAPDAPPNAFARVPVELAADRLARVIRDRRPSVVVGYEPGGGYGHPDHVQAHRVMQRAVELAALGSDGWQVSQVLWAAVDAEALAVGRAAVADLAGPGLAPPTAALGSAVVRPEQVDLRVDVAPVAESVLAGLAAHATQVQQVRRVDRPGVVGAYALSGAALAPVLAVEVYRVGVAAGVVTWPAGVRVP